VAWGRVRCRWHSIAGVRRLCTVTNVRRAGRLPSSADLLDQGAGVDLRSAVALELRDLSNDTRHCLGTWRERRQPQGSQATLSTSPRLVLQATQTTDRGGDGRASVEKRPQASVTPAVANWQMEGRPVLMKTRA
jgi:hypothetical protein